MIGTRLDKWVIDRELGRGGMGVVYLAHAEGTAPAAQAAVKVLAAELARDPRFQQRFQREIAALSLLDHPNIVRFFAAGVQDGIPYYVMEYVDGPSYETVVEEQGRLPWQDVLALALQVCPALKHAHDRGIVHRDLKPANLLRDATGAVKLTDFGIAKVFASNRLTATGGLIGTADFLSPEQAAGKPATKRSDLYSLGAVLYTLLVGRPPFEGTGMADLLHKHRYAQPEPPRNYLPQLPYEIDEVVLQLLEKDPAKRPPDGLVLHRQLDRLRRKLERKAAHTNADARASATRSDDDGVSATDGKPGGATLMSRLMRRELDREQRGGPLTQFMNQPLVLVLLLAACVGLIVWGLRRADPGPEALMEGARPLMRSSDPDDRERAWSDYLEPLERRYPDHPYGDEVAAFRRRGDDQRALRRALAATKGVAPSEARRFYQRGLRLCQDGNPAGARRVWQDVVDTFGKVESEQDAVLLAEQGLAALNARQPDDGGRWDSVHEVLRSARAMKRDEAERVWNGLEDLYRDDPSAGAVLAEIRRDRAGKKDGG